MKLLLLFVLGTTVMARGPLRQKPHENPTPGMMPVRMVRQKPHENPTPGMMPVQEGCAVPSWKADNYCDDENNTEGCEWDGGDCCENDNGSWDYYCKACECLDPQFQAPQEVCGVPSWKADKYCDNENNNAGCEWDGGDCCGNTMEGWDYYCKPNCQCLDPNFDNGGGNGGSDGDCFCGVKNEATRITGGSESAPNEYPWQIALMTQSSSFQFCGGSILNSKYILTAAHCTISSSASMIKVRVGEHDKSVNGDGAIDINVEKIINHPDYDPSSVRYDFSILQLATPITFTDKVRPVCLPASTAPTYAGVTGVASGWGRLGTDQPGPQALHHVELDVYAADDCQKWGAVHESKICAGGKDGKAVCNGDSGGPLVTFENGHWTVIGVSSYVSITGCEAEGYPSVFARVTNQLNWINQNIASGEFCPAPPNAP